MNWEGPAAAPFLYWEAIDSCGDGERLCCEKCVLRLPSVLLWFRTRGCSVMLPCWLCPLATLCW